jgi:hypothetical protein
MFSKTYLKQPAGQNKDSARLRNRLGAFAWKMDEATRGAFVQLVEAETGAKVPYGVATHDVGKFFATAEMRDVLDAVTCMTRALRERYGARDAEEWIAFCQRAFAEEGMANSIDDAGEAHYVVDVAFHETADSVIAALSREPFAGAGACMNKAVEEITKAKPDGKHAIRDTFEGVETVFKVVTKTTKDLTTANIDALLRPIVDRRFPDKHPIAKGAAQQTLESLKDWTNACHKYRHGQKAEEPVEPPLDLAIVLVGNGLNFGRWIGSLAN